MSRYIIAVFSSYEEANEIVNQMRTNGLSGEFTILNNLPKLSAEDYSPKVDGFISGVSDLFIGLPVFVNPMSAFGLPPQYNAYDYKEEKWRRFGIDRFKAMQYQEMMTSGKSVVAIKAGNNHKKILEFLEREAGNPPVEIIRV